jgi:hypothetical protein
MSMFKGADAGTSEGAAATPSAPDTGHSKVVIWAWAVAAALWLVVLVFQVDTYRMQHGHDSFISPVDRQVTGVAGNH